MASEIFYFREHLKSGKRDTARVMLSEDAACSYAETLASKGGCYVEVERLTITDGAQRVAAYYPPKPEQLNR